MRAAINVTRKKSHVHTNVLQPKKEPRSRGAQAFDGTELPSVICCRRSHAARSPAAGWTLGCATRASAASCPGRWSRACSRPRCAATAHVAELRLAEPRRPDRRWSRADVRLGSAARAPAANLHHPGRSWKTGRRLEHHPAHRSRSTRRAPRRCGCRVVRWLASAATLERGQRPYRARAEPAVRTANAEPFLVQHDLDLADLLLRQVHFGYARRRRGCAVPPRPTTPPVRSRRSCACGRR